MILLSAARTSLLMMGSSLFLLVLLAGCADAGGHQYPEDFTCSLCVDFIQEVLLDGREDPFAFCSRLDVCEYLKENMILVPEFLHSMDYHGNTPFKTCTALRMCIVDGNTTEYEMADMAWEDSDPSVPELSLNQTNFRVSKAFGPYGYDYVRFSVIDDLHIPRSVAFKDFFLNGGYVAPFRYRWTNKMLYSKVVYVAPNTGTQLNLGPNFIVNITLPSEKRPVRGLVVADPCIGSTWVSCAFGDSYKILNRLSQALNIAAEEEAGLDFWMILGDMFYDRTTTYADIFMKKLSAKVRATPLTVTLGNHDIWVRGHPLLKAIGDQFGNGFMQYFAQDAIAAYNMTDHSGTLPYPVPFNFSVNPDSVYTFFHEYHELAAKENFIYYHMMGNIGIFVFSGAHPWEDTQTYAEKACQFFVRHSPRVVLVINHWDGINDGAQNLTGSIMRTKFLSIPSCKLTMPVHFVVGHTHCNQVLENGNGFLVGGQGMSGCSQFGIPFIETTKDDRLEVVYYPLETPQGSRPDVWNCILAHGFAGCKSLADVWYNKTLIDHVTL